MRKHFEAQLRNTKPTDGDYLGKVTREQALDTLRSMQKQGVNFYDTPENILEQKIQEHKDHAGEKLVYFLGYHAPKQFIGNTKPSRVAVVKVWESEIDGLGEKWVAMDPVMIENSTMPRLEEKAQFYE